MIKYYGSIPIVKIENIIRLFGWSGVIIGIIAIVKRDIWLFLVWQLVSNISGFLWNNYLQKKVSWDTILSLSATILAVITKDQFVAYAAMLARSISYQLIFERFVQNNKGKGIASNKS